MVTSDALAHRQFRLGALLILLASAQATAEVVVQRWGVEGRLQHPGTVRIEQTDAGKTMVFDLAGLPKAAKVHRARLRLAGTGGMDGFELVADGKALPLVEPYCRWFDATAAVARWAADPSRKGTILIKRAGRFDRKSVCLEIAYEGTLAAPPAQVSDVKAFCRSGQVFLTFKETVSLDGGKDDLTWKDLAETLKSNKRGLGGFSPLGLRPDDSGGEFRYRVYRHDRPITAETIAQAQLLAEVTPGSRLNPRIAHVNVHGERGPRTLKGGAPVLRLAVEELKPLPAGRGVYVHTVTADGKGYYAVVAAADGVENTRDFSSNTAGPVEEKAAPPAPVLTYDKVDKIQYRQGKQTLEATYHEQWYSYWVAPPLAPFPMRHDVVVCFSPELMTKPAPLEIARTTEWQATPAAPGWPYGKPPPIRHVYLAQSTEYPLCFYTGVNDALHTLKGLRQGRWTPTVQNRQMALIAWLRQRLPIDEQRVHVNMRVWGMMEMEHPELYSYVRGWCQPDFTKGFQCFNHARGAWGPPQVYAGRAAAEDPYRRTNGSRLALADVAAEMPYLVQHSSTGAHNSEMGWPAFPDFYRALMDSKRAFSASWGKHSWIWPGTPAYKAVTSGRLVIRRDQSVPAFAHCTLDDNPGCGDIRDGDRAGQINGYLLWDPDTITDKPDAWEMTIWLDASAPRDAAVDLTPRRCQQFRAKAGERFRWTNALLPDKAKPAEAGQRLQSGTASADKFGLVTLGGLKITRARHRVSVAR